MKLRFRHALVELSFEPYADPIRMSSGIRASARAAELWPMDDRRISEARRWRARAVWLNRAYFYTRFQELFRAARRGPAALLSADPYGADSRLEGVQIGFLSTPSDRFAHRGLALRGMSRRCKIKRLDHEIYLDGQ